jgi:RNA polymerase sigma factor for flagellar operon FliA
VDATARQRLVNEHLSLVRALSVQIKKQVSDQLEVEDLVGYGTAGLLEAAQRFDPSIGVVFSTFAYHRIRGAIYDGVRQMGQLPRSVYARLRAAERASEVLENLQEREIGAAASGVPITPTSEDDLRSLYNALSAVTATYVTSLEALSESEREIPSEAQTADEALEKRQASQQVLAAVAKLPEKEKHFIQKHYFEGQTLQDAGATLGLSKSWASRLHARAIERLRDALADS